MQQKNQAPMSEEEQEGEVIDRRNTEEISLFFPIPPFLSSAPFNRVMSFPVGFFLRRAPGGGGRVTEEGGAWRNVRLPSLVTFSLPPPTHPPSPYIAYWNRKWAHTVLRLLPSPHQTRSDVTPVPSALSESLTVNRDDKTHQISASAVIGWFLQYRRSFLVMSLGKEKVKDKVVFLPFFSFHCHVKFHFCSSLFNFDFSGGIAWHVRV